MPGKFELRKTQAQPAFHSPTAVEPPPNQVRLLLFTTSGERGLLMVNNQNFLRFIADLRYAHGLQPTERNSPKVNSREWRVFGYQQGLISMQYTI
jgi:hypothetical protein